MTPTAPAGSPGPEPAPGIPTAVDPATDQHPAIAEPPVPVADEKGSLDRMVFAVSAVVALAFVAWGFLSPGGLGAAAGSGPRWVEGEPRWVFVTPASPL